MTVTTLPLNTAKYAAHCHDCDQFRTCTQAQHMQAEIEPVSGYVETDQYVDYFCPDCLPDDCPDETTFPLDYEETDSPCHCSVCGIPLIHSLTADGVWYVRDAIASGSGCCREVWPTVWSELLPDEPYFDRFDICEAYYIHARNTHDHKILARLHRMQFRPGLSLRQSDCPETALTENGQAIYYRLIARRNGVVI